MKAYNTFFKKINSTSSSKQVFKSSLLWRHFSSFIWFCDKQLRNDIISCMQGFAAILRFFELKNNPPIFRPIILYSASNNQWRCATASECGCWRRDAVIFAGYKPQQPLYRICWWRLVVGNVMERERGSAKRARCGSSCACRKYLLNVPNLGCVWLVQKRVFFQSSAPFVNEVHLQRKKLFEGAPKTNEALQELPDLSSEEFLGISSFFSFF